MGDNVSVHEVHSVPNTLPGFADLVRAHRAQVQRECMKCFGTGLLSYIDPHFVVRAPKEWVLSRHHHSSDLADADTNVPRRCDVCGGSGRNISVDEWKNLALYLGAIEAPWAQCIAANILLVLSTPHLSFPNTESVRVYAEVSAHQTCLVRALTKE